MMILRIHKHMKRIFPTKINRTTMIVVVSFFIINANNPPKIVQNATNVPLKSTEFKSSVKNGLSFACFQSIINRITKTAMDLASFVSAVSPINTIMKAFRYRNMNSLRKLGF